ncbi:MAG: MarR family transcriptional regulator [Gammaproteobacteria bacterium]|nr:MarR family transcriptional regulator [Gammaproteobacteria bacterium]
MNTYERDLFRLIHLSAEFIGSRKCFGTQVVSQAELNVIAGLHQKAPCTLKDLADLLQITNSACSQQVERLVQKGFIERMADKRDRRSVRLALTTSGDSVMSAYRQCQDSIVEGLAKKLRKEDKIAAGAVIKAVADTLEERIREM